MYDTTRKQYLIKLTSGKIQNIFFKENTGICLSTLNKRNIWLESTTLIKDALPNFSVCLDESDNIHILYQDKHGNISKVIYNSTNWDIKPVLNSKNPSSYEKHLHVTSISENIYFFYVLEYSGSKLLSYQFQTDSGSLSTPKVIDYVPEVKNPYNIVKGNDSQLYVFYRCPGNKENQIGYRKYNSSKDQWSELYSIPNLHGEIEILSVAVDYRNNFHICWQTAGPQKYELMYSRRNFNSEIWEPGKSLSILPSPFSNFSIIALGETIISYWIKENFIYYFMSPNNGDTWGKHEKYTFYDIKPLYCFSYNSNMPGDNSGIYFTELPGNFSGGYKLAFINDPGFKTEISKTDDMRSIVVDTLKLLSINIDELKHSIKEINQKIETLEAAQNQIEVDITKLGMPNSDLSKIKVDIEMLKKWKQKSDSTEPEKTRLENSILSHIELSKPKDESDILINSMEYPEKNEGPDMNHSTDDVEKGYNPIMPGAGFASITPEYLRNLRKK